MNTSGTCRYSGPCGDEVQTFAGMTVEAKKRWSEGCQVSEFAAQGLGPRCRPRPCVQAYFPCKSAHCLCVTWHALLGCCAAPPTTKRLQAQLQCGVP